MLEGISILLMSKEDEFNRFCPMMSDKHSGIKNLRREKKTTTKAENSSSALIGFQLHFMSVFKNSFQEQHFFVLILKYLLTVKLIGC